MHDQERDAELNSFAIRCFRDTADGDYLAARLAYRAKLIPQFLWSALQCIEKYFKCVLLLNRIPNTKATHNLGGLLNKIQSNAPFRMKLSPSSLKLVEHLDRFGKYRYLEVSHYVVGWELPQLDRAVWEIRRYCEVLAYKFKTNSGEEIDMLEVHLATIDAYEKLPPQRFRLLGSALDKILGNPDDPAREILAWQNLYFGRRPRKNIRITKYFQATNSPLSLDPHILEDVLKYVYLPHDLISEFREVQKHHISN